MITEESAGSNVGLVIAEQWHDHECLYLIIRVRISKANVAYGYDVLNLETGNIEYMPEQYFAAEFGIGVRLLCE